MAHALKILRKKLTLMPNKVVWRRRRKRMMLKKQWKCEEYKGRRFLSVRSTRGGVCVLDTTDC
jgi:streptomycin 6-kinase